MKGFIEPNDYETDQGNTNHQILKSGLLKDAILNSLPAQLIFLNADGIIEAVNQSWITFAKENFFCGTAGQDFTGVNYIELCRESTGPYCDHAADAVRGITSVLEGTIPSFALEYRCHFQGKQKWFLLELNTLPDVQGVLVSHTEITGRKATEQMKDDFISIASHELKTPITSLKGIVHILQLSFDKKVRGETSKLLNTMDIQLDKLSKIISDLLVVNGSTCNQIYLNDEKFNFKNLVKETVRNVRNISPLHFLSVKENESVYFNGDRFRLEQVITNLLTNAVKYSPQSNQVIINSIVKDNSILFSVQDFGLGIEKENISRIFDKFYRVTAGHTFGGLGLGLFISSEIIKSHNGSLWVESEAGKGSTFYVSLPLR